MLSWSTTTSGRASKPPLALLPKVPGLRLEDTSIDADTVSLTLASTSLPAACPVCVWQDHGLVFPSTIGTPLSHCDVVRSFKAVLHRAGLPSSVRLYDLRHTCATLLLSRNVHPKYVQELLGHRSIALTLDTYSHVIPGMDGGTASAMEDALG